MPNKKDQSAVTHDDLANAIRFLSIDAVEKAKSGLLYAPRFLN